MKIQTRRVYEPADPSDGTRILIDRLWPRGLVKAKADVDFWAKSIAPSSELRKWFKHEPERWPKFRERYFAELDANPDGLSELRAHLGSGTATLLFGSREERLNNASALREYLEGGKSGGTD